MKDYLTSESRTNIAETAALVDKLDTLSKDNKNLTKDEIKYLKTATTFISKAHTSIFTRLNVSALKTLQNTINNMEVVVINNFSYELLKKKKETDSKKGYEASREFYDLIEATLQVACEKCTREANSCPLYHKLEENSIIDGGHNINNCKYSYIEYKKK